MFEKEVLSLWFCHFKFSNPISSWIWCTTHHCHWMCKNNLIFTAVKNWHFICPFYCIIDLIGSILISILISASNWFSSYKYIRAQTSLLKRTIFFYFAAIYLSLGYLQLNKIYIFYEWKRYKIGRSLKWSPLLFGNKGPMFQNISLAIKLLRGEDKENILETVR